MSTDDTQESPVTAQEVPPAPPLRHWRCPKGHDQRDTEEFSFRIGNAFTGKLMHDTGPLCYQCVFDFACGGIADREYDEGGPNWYGAVFGFLTEHFQTRRVAPPDETVAPPAEPDADRPAVD